MNAVMACVALSSRSDQVYKRRGRRRYAGFERGTSAILDLGFPTLAHRFVIYGCVAHDTTPGTVGAHRPQRKSWARH